MTSGDAVEFAGYLFSCWVIGFGMGYMVQLFRKFSEQV